MSPSEPPIRINEASASRYAFETHCCAVSPPPRSRSIAGNATLTIELSIETTADPRIAASKISRWRRPAISRHRVWTGCQASPEQVAPITFGPLERIVARYHDIVQIGEIAEPARGGRAPAGPRVVGLAPFTRRIGEATDVPSVSDGDDARHEHGAGNRRCRAPPERSGRRPEATRDHRRTAGGRWPTRRSSSSADMPNGNHSPRHARSAPSRRKGVVGALPRLPCGRRFHRCPRDRARRRSQADAVGGSVVGLTLLNRGGTGSQDQAGERSTPSS